MKSITFFVLFLLLSFTSYAQGSYQIINIVDDFGDPTGKLCYTIPFQNGHFSNSATKDARLTGRLNIVLGDTTKSKFKISSIAMGWEFYEYGKYRVDDEYYWPSARLYDANNNVVKTINKKHPAAIVKAMVENSNIVKAKVTTSSLDDSKDYSWIMYNDSFTFLREYMRRRGYFDK
ncbi:MAG: hypothetical protein IJP79_08120 [Paludibacteraceae bacterium]|nr:hypothetical protein [Paludibacteraceae bacterium]MBQ9509765.1 hypothetical protein [Bacteroidales bacterium]